MTIQSGQKKFNRRRQATGASDAAQQQATNYSKQLQSKANSIALPIDGTDVEFELIIVPFNEIKTTTTVFKDNARLQMNLNEVSVSDILGTIKQRGQQYPAIGRYLEDGRIEVLDGSRRRFSCMLASADFLIYVTRGNINDTNLRFLSDVANKQKPLSLFEKGLQYEKMLKDGVYEDAKELAVFEGITESSVSAARSSLELPDNIRELIPSIGDLGRPLLNSLRKSVSELKRKGLLGSLEQFIKTLSIPALKVKSNGDTNPKVLNKLFVDSIAAFAEPEKQITIDDQLKRPLFKKGKVKAFIKQTKKGFQIDLEGVGEDKKAAILAAIELELKTK